MRLCISGPLCPSSATRLGGVFGTLLLLAVLLVPAPALAQAPEQATLSQLLRATHVHGLAVDPADSARLYIATHHGLYVAGADRVATRVSQKRDDYMSFSLHPKEPVFYASGHPATGGNLGFLVSKDGGRTWTRIALGVHGPVDFHQMAVSWADPKVIYGVYGVLQVSRDGGETWQTGGVIPDVAYDVATSAQGADTVYVATEQGLLVSRNAGADWAPAHPDAERTTLVTSTADGSVYAFIPGQGLYRAQEPELKWEHVGPGYGTRVLVHLAVDSKAPRRLLAMSHLGDIVESGDGGKSWRTLAAP